MIQSTEAGKTQHLNPGHAGNHRLLILKERAADGVFWLSSVNDIVAIADHVLFPPGQDDILSNLSLPGQWIRDDILEASHVS